MSKTVAIIGASDRKNRYAYRAMVSLQEHGYEVRLVNPYKENIAGKKCYKAVSEISDEINTVTLYVNPQKFRNHIDEVIQAGPQRVIMNPGTEDAEMEATLKNAGINVICACTLVMLSTGKF